MVLEVFEWAKTSFYLFQIESIPVHVRSIIPSLFSDADRYSWEDGPYELERKNNRLSQEKSNLESRVRWLVNENTELSNEKSYLESRVRRLVNENTELSNEKRRAAYVSSTLEYRVRELEHQNTKLSAVLVKQREDTRKAGLLFMNAADTYQHVADRQIRTKEEELANTRKTGLLLMNAADAYQEVAKKQIKAMVEDLKDARKAVLVVMDAADTYQQVAEKQIKDKVEELRVLGVHKAEMDARAASLESELEAALAKNQELEAYYSKVLIENDRLWSRMELVEAKETSTNAFDSDEAEIMKELEDHKMKVEENHSSKDLRKGENDKIQLEVLTAEQKNSMFEAGVERLKMELDVLVEAKKAKSRSNQETLRGEVKEIQAAMDFVKRDNDKLWLEASEAGVERLKENI
ncbi:hypothetical protein OsJ_13749 [Oryza sativa Japonica Group]|uniref:Uncharacterized protein n=4 Tax=Oryza sativa TaxID=4530 RepID=A0A8J8XTR4_ORYSJ|nr:hypothetical protein OsJ_13749 [Oryza sativa Japonica Group]CAE05581.2 OSJNBa0032N05.24 [Oryza sativa Japonica Group]